jgi:hypothetical protein
MTVASCAASPVRHLLEAWVSEPEQADGPLQPTLSINTEPHAIGLLAPIDF